MEVCPSLNIIINIIIIMMMMIKIILDITLLQADRAVTFLIVVKNYIPSLAAEADFTTESACYVSLYLHHIISVHCRWCVPVVDQRNISLGRPVQERKCSCRLVNSVLDNNLLAAT